MVGESVINSIKSSEMNPANMQQQYVNVAHMIFEYKTNQGGDKKNLELKRNLQKGIFNRETDFTKLRPLAERMSPPCRSPSKMLSRKLKKEPYVVND